LAGDGEGDGHAQALRSLLQLTRTRLERTLAHVVTLGRLDGRERLLSFLVDMARRVGRVEDGYWSVSVPMTREDMADHLGLNADTVTRILGLLKREGLVLARSSHDFLIPESDSGIDSSGLLASETPGLAPAAHTRGGS
jgi:CRP-like cAMP-binding protein